MFLNVGVKGLGDIFDASNSYADGSTAQISKERCVAAIQHQIPLGIDEQFACAAKGYSGNAAWPRPQPMPQPIESVQKAVAQAQAPVTSLPLVGESPKVPVVTVYPDPSPPISGMNCESLNDWIANNKGLAALILVGLWLLKGSGESR